MNHILMEFRQYPGVWELKLMGQSRHDDPIDLQSRIHIELCVENWNLSGLYVPHANRGLGHGKELMLKALRFCEKTAPEKPITLETRPFGRGAPNIEFLRMFYAKFGFVRWPHHPTSMVRWPTEDRAEPSNGHPWCEACKSYHATPRDLAHYLELQCKALPVPVDLTNRVCAHCGGHEFHQPQGRSAVIECNRCGAQCEGGAAPA